MGPPAGHNLWIGDVRRRLTERFNYLGNIETKEEADWYHFGELLTIYTEQFICNLGVFIIYQKKPWDKICTGEMWFWMWLLTYIQH